jgi:hypothetical protein
MSGTIQIQYADVVVGNYSLHRSPVSRRGFLGSLPGQGDDGYGRKITTEIKLKFAGESRAYRVYSTCFSNAASHWIIRKGVKLWLRDHSQDEVLD